MITHIVLLQPKTGISHTQMITALDHVQALQQAIPGILLVRTGKNLNSTNDQGYTYGFVIQFADRATYEGYAPHLAHQPVSEELRHLCQSIIDFDMAER
ncbi:MAG: Dabb family protein [Ktedonobacteraceae bacterium]